MIRQKHWPPVTFLILSIAVLMLAGCGNSGAVERSNAPAAPAGQTSQESEGETTAVPTNEAAEAATTTLKTEPTEIPAESTLVPQQSGEPIDVEEALRLMSDLLYDQDAAPQALQRVLDAGDRRFTAVFIELIRGLQLGLVRSGLSGVDLLHAIEDLNRGESTGENWFELIEWYGKTDLEPPPGFTSWKGRMLSQIDPGFAQFLQDDLPADIRVEEIQWGGVPLDGIPALDRPAMLAAADADYLEPENVVFGIELNGEARAYPRRILDWHEMANDVIGDVPVSLAYCTLCGAAVAFDGRASDGNVYDFGSSGFLFRSNKLMYDRQTKTLWNQLTGKPVLGELVGSSIQLDILPVVLTTWEAWRAEHPDTLVVDINTGYNRDYRPGAAYGDYFAYEDTMFPVWQRSDLLDPKDQIYAIRINEIPKAYPLETLAEEKVVNDELGGETVVLVTPGDIIQIEGESLRGGAVTYDAGSTVRAYARGEHEFASGAEVGTLLDENGHVWQVLEEALIGPNGEELERLGGHLAYWFGWYAFFPNTSVYGK